MHTEEPGTALQAALVFGQLLTVKIENMKKMRRFLSVSILTILVLFSSIPVNAATFNIDFDTNSAAIELVNLDTDTVVYQKNADVRREPASTTKIMTFIVASEQIKDLDGTKITITKELMDTLLGTGSSMMLTPR